MSQQVVDRLETLGGILPQFERDQVFIVVDTAAYAASGARDRLTPLLNGYGVEYFDVGEPNPRIEQVLTGARLLRQHPKATVVAIGGGTAIDMAKAICHAAAQPVTAQADAAQQYTAARHDAKVTDIDLFTPSAQPRTVPLVVVPTTAGTGSEATHFAVVYVDGVKHSLAHPSLLPDAVVLDATLTASLPPDMTAATGLDAVAQAIESLWSVEATEASSEVAERALRLGLRHLEPAVNRPTPADREAMLAAANLAGQAINVSRTTAPHALSYTLTSQHGVPHGAAVALCLAPFLRFNGRDSDSGVTHPGGVAGLRASLARIAAAFDVSPADTDAMDKVANRWQQLVSGIDCPTRLRDCGIQGFEDLETIVASVNQQRLAGNPRTVSELDLWQIVNEMA